MHDDRVARGRRDEFLDARERALHRAPGDFRQHRQRRLLRDFIFAAEVAADDGRHHADARQRQLQRARHVGASERDTAERRVDGQAAVGVPRSDRAMRLKRHVFDHLRREGILENAIRLTKTFFDIALGDQFGGVDVARRRMHLRRAVLHRLNRIVDRRQRFVFNFDFVERFKGDLFGHGGHCSHAVAGMEHARVGKNRLVLDRRAEGIHRDVLAGDDGHYAGHGRGFARVDLLDQRR